MVLNDCKPAENETDIPFFARRLQSSLGTSFVDINRHAGIRDLMPLPQRASNSLKDMAWQILGLTIQNTSRPHDPMEDASATAKIYAAWQAHQPQLGGKAHKFNDIARLLQQRNYRLPNLVRGASEFNTTHDPVGRRE